MWSYTPPLRDMQFVMDELLEVRKDWARMPIFAELDATMGPQILEEAGKFAANVLAPTNAAGDRYGCHYADGAVATPEGFGQAYGHFREAGWPALACAAEFGGQALPQIFNAALYEMLNAANHAWTMYPGLAHGAYECLRAHAPEAIKEAYLPKIVSGEWLSTMCLTEPQAGSDVGLIRTVAEPRADGSYAVSGNKIFISGGEHDLTQNIVHLVLARLPDAPPGTRGISLFLVPKFIGTAAMEPNGVACDGLESKMGIKGSATCAMSFKSSQGWLIGEPHRGLAAMFVMMNSARLMVGLQGLGHAEMAYQNALRYASERVQMRAVRKPAAARSNGADPIILHPAIRKTLMTQRAVIEGERALGYLGAHLLDVAEYHADPTVGAQAHDLVSLLTPVIKSFFTENGFVLTAAAQQVWGGYGYIRDYGVEQSVRDSRIAMIYEGTNEIQAVDLLVRKVIGDAGKKFALLLQWVREEAAQCASLAGCERFAQVLDAMHAALSQVTAAIIAESPQDAEMPHRIASDYLKLVALILLGSLWARTARVAMSRQSEDFYRAKLETANFYFDYVMPEAQWRLNLLQQRGSQLPFIEAG